MVGVLTVSAETLTRHPGRLQPTMTTTTKTGAISHKLNRVDCNPNEHKADVSCTCGEIITITLLSQGFNAHQVLHYAKTEVIRDHRRDARAAAKIVQQANAEWNRLYDLACEAALPMNSKAWNKLQEAVNETMERITEDNADHLGGNSVLRAELHVTAMKAIAREFGVVA